MRWGQNHLIGTAHSGKYIKCALQHDDWVLHFMENMSFSSSLGTEMKKHLPEDGTEPCAAVVLRIACHCLKPHCILFSLTSGVVLMVFGMSYLNSETVAVLDIIACA